MYNNKEAILFSDLGWLATPWQVQGQHPNIDNKIQLDWKLIQSENIKMLEPCHSSE